MLLTANTAVAANLFLTGLRDELEKRYSEALRLKRNVMMSWDAATMSWVSISATF